MQFNVEPETCLNSALTAKGAAGQLGSSPNVNLAQNGSLDSLAAPAIALTLRTISLSGHGYKLAREKKLFMEVFFSRW
jgi:hypothetical protein